MERSVENSLAALRTDHLDVLLIHRPDALMDADALAECFGRLRSAGKVLHFGVSNFTPSQFALLNRRIGLVTNKVEASPLHIAALHDGTLDQAQEQVLIRAKEELDIKGRPIRENVWDGFFYDDYIKPVNGLNWGSAFEGLPRTDLAERDG